ARASCSDVDRKTAPHNSTEGDPMTIDLLRSLSSALDALVLEVDSDLPLAGDIHPAIHDVGEYLADLVRLPAELSKLEAKKASAEASLAARETSVRRANHAVRMAEDKLKKLGERIDHHLEAQSADVAPAAKPSVIPGLVLQTRQEIIEGLRKEILAAEDALATARGAAKKAESIRKGVVTRITNLAKKIEAAKEAVTDHSGRLEKTIRVLRKTINHLRNRQEKRDAKKRASEPVIETVETPSDTTPKGPNDEDIRKLAASHGLPIDCPADLEAARQLFLN
ncbi:MAG TPA: hypothetical protein VL283_05705, partial [Candidatus Baltobacteraceae bacterium]|nr:hypothetical protein [Candidatus Baltobacteraceae bacterium]